MPLGTWQLCEGSNNICNQTLRSLSQNGGCLNAMFKLNSGYTKCSGISTIQ
jgi:hypothetical protein